MADLVAQLHTDVIGDEAGQEVIAEHLGGLLLAEVLTRPGGVHLIGAIGRVPGSRGSSRCPPSLRAILRSLYFLIGLDHSRSAGGLDDVHRLQRGSSHPSGHPGR